MCLSSDWHVFCLPWCFRFRFLLSWEEVGSTITWNTYWLGAFCCIWCGMRRGSPRTPRSYRLGWMSTWTCSNCISHLLVWRRTYINFATCVFLNSSLSPVNKLSIGMLLLSIDWLIDRCIIRSIDWLIAICTSDLVVLWRDVICVCIWLIGMKSWQIFKVVYDLICRGWRHDQRTADWTGHWRCEHGQVIKIHQRSRSRLHFMVQRSAIRRGIGGHFEAEETPGSHQLHMAHVSTHSRPIGNETLLDFWFSIQNFSKTKLDKEFMIKIKIYQVRV